MKTTLQERIASARTEKGWTQQRLAKEVGISQPTLSALEKKEGVSSKFLPEVARALSVNFRWLHSGEGPRYPGDIELTPDEQALIWMWRQYTPEAQKIMKIQLEAVLGSVQSEQPLAP